MPVDDWENGGLSNYLTGLSNYLTLQLDVV